MSRLVAYLIIPMYTLFFVRGSNWFSLNFSILGNHITRREGFLLWGLIMGVYTYKTFGKVIKIGGNNIKEKLTKNLAIILLFCAITTPYLPRLYPVKSNLHIIFAFFAAVSMLLCMLFIVIRIIKVDKNMYRFLYSLVAIIIVSLGILAYAGMVSSALEIFVSVSSVYWIESLKNRLVIKKESEGNGKIII